jgi:esterase
MLELNYRVLGKGKPVIILHGVFGTADNWQTFGKKLAESYQVYLVDLRNHGLSPHSNTFDYPSMAKDIQQFCARHSIQKPVLLGHSMGGKVAMYCCVMYPELAEKLIVVDIAPRAYPVHHQKILEGLNAVRLEQATSRKDVEEQLGEYIPEFGVRQFLIKNLKRSAGNHFQWKLNVPVISNNIELIGKKVPDDKPIKIPAFFIKGEQSHYIRKSDYQQIKYLFPQATIASVTGAGHWVHAEKPAELLAEVQFFLSGA